MIDWSTDPESGTGDNFWPSYDKRVFLEPRFAYLSRIAAKQRTHQASAVSSSAAQRRPASARVTREDTAALGRPVSAKEPTTTHAMESFVSYPDGFCPSHTAAPGRENDRNDAMPASLKKTDSFAYASDGKVVSVTNGRVSCKPNSHHGFRSEQSNMVRTLALALAHAHAHAHTYEPTHTGAGVLERVSPRV